MLECLNGFEGSDRSAGTRFPHRLVVRGAASAVGMVTGSRADFLLVHRIGRRLLVGSEEARFRAGLRPPLKLHVRFSRMQLSRRLSPTFALQDDFFLARRVSPSNRNARFRKAV